MIQTIIEALDAAANQSLNVTTRSGLAELRPMSPGTAPHVYIGDEQWLPVATDNGGSYSYWRITAPLQETTAQGTSCTNDFKATYQLRLVMCVDRSICPVVIDAARSVMSAIRNADPWSILHLRPTSSTNAVRAEVDSAKVYQQEFGQAGDVPPEKVLIAIDVTAIAIGRPECFEPCGPVTSLLCALVSTASWLRIKACMTAGQLTDAENDLCDGPVGPCADATVTWDTLPLLTIASGETQNIDCDSLVNAAYVTDGGSVTGCYKVTGTENSREVFTLDASHSLRYTGTLWRLVKPGADIDAGPGTETKPWDADWSATTLTVEQSTIAGYCDNCAPCEVDVTVNDTPFGTATGGTFDVSVVDGTGTAVGSKVGDDWVVPTAKSLCQLVTEGTSEEVATCVTASGKRQGVLAELIPTVDPANVLADIIGPMTPEQDDVVAVTVQLRDSAANNIGSADTYAAGTNTTKTAPDGTVTIRNSVPTTLHSVAVKSNGSETQDIADSTITRPDATTEGLPATVALDVRNYRSGIAYQFGLVLASGQTTAYRTGDEGSFRADGFFGYTPPVYPTSFALLGADFVTLASNNIHGNTLRFTARDGSAAATSGLRIVQDHLTGLEWRVPASMPAATTWNTAIDTAVADSTGGSTDWRIPSDRMLDSITNDELSNCLGYQPFASISATFIWTSTTLRVDTTQAKRFNLGPANSTIASAAKTSASGGSYIMCRRFIA